MTDCGTRFLHLKISTAKRITLVLKKGELIYDKDLSVFFYGDGITIGGNPFGVASYIAVEKNTNFTITNEDFVRAYGSTALTFTLPAIGSKVITIKNTSTEILTIVPPSGLINGVASLELEPLLAGGFAEGNLGSSVDLIYQGGQFWRT